jgi:hypothetical protein
MLQQQQATLNQNQANNQPKSKGVGTRVFTCKNIQADNVKSIREQQVGFSGLSEK